MSDFSLDPKTFNGIARLFPLPNVVLFPYAIQGLHIFEPRYREMTADSLTSDRLIAMTLLQPGWEADYDGTPAIHPVGCVGKIVWHDALEDGRYNLQLRGVFRVRILEELPSKQSFRSARVQLLYDTDHPSSAVQAEFRQKFRKLIALWCTGQPKARSMLLGLLDSSLALGVVGDLLAFALPVSSPFKQTILECTEVARRLHLLAEHLEAQQPSAAPEENDRTFPPGFSSN